ncbi:MAG: DegV family EDD domain-containing protein [Proteobacteria bacterium]|nr:DegV family EDD domain-containing protein [Pseudomonadota bacterium]MBU4296453.1 DegV family EDD domain-containing protein [Pseudomonadota bacterium]MCG2748722.1 DegV family EDD domain-containing protein [Desulfobulbaceae bacterium]
MRKAFAAGYHNLSAWADLLDRINVFPVADGDTGANLRISLAPLRDSATVAARTRELLARCAIGNSGNIAAAFFQEFCRAQGFGDLAGQAAQGRDNAWQALAAPRAGTMLDVFDAMVPALAGKTDAVQLYPMVCRELSAVVRATSGMLPDLRQAGVVDAGALGMYVFFEGFFRQLAGQSKPPASILELFAGKLTINAAFQAISTGSYCVNVVIDTGTRQAGADKGLAALGESVVVLPAETGFKVHVHTGDRQQLRARLAALGEIVHWSDEAIEAGDVAGFADPAGKQVVHIMTDAAGSLTREMARHHCITLLDSYILAGDDSRPESLCSPADIYALMRAGSKVSTAQASLFERHQYYQSVCQRFGRTLYLCVGSVFTGNYDAARRWKEDNDPHDLLQVMDTGAASGRLGLIALLAARFSEHAANADDVAAFAGRIMDDCREYVFIDELHYLVSGGRVSRTGGFLADLLHMKPVISPTREGVRKAGVVHSRKGQLSFALERLQDKFAASAAPVILLQYSDNEAWVAETVQPRVRELLPGAEILLTPLSLTSGVHMGPGTWSLAWAGGK